MKPERVDPLIGEMNFFKAMAYGTLQPSESDRINNEIGDIVVDTCLAGDTNTWETGIKREAGGGEWLIVEQYPDREAAEIGHQKWIDLMTEYPDYPLKDIDMWSLGDCDE